MAAKPMSTSSDVAFRAATPGDYNAFALLYVEFGAREAAPGPEHFVQRIAPWTVIAENGEAAALGFITSTIWGDLLRIEYLVVAPEARGSGLSVRLVARALHDARRAGGVARVELTVMPQNERAIYLYETLGLERDYPVLVVQVDDAVIARLPPAPRPVSLLLDRAVDPARTDASLALPPGTIEAGLQYGYSVIVLCDADAVVGAVVFDPNHERMSRFAVASASFLRPLLEAVSSARRAAEAAPSAAGLELTIEGFADVQRALLDAGAVVSLDLVAMNGALDLAIERARTFGAR
jgi:ribosomal protein S18 acetylase RimI-like enzyme